MGVHVSVFDETTGHDVPVSVWDYLRQGNDKSLPRLWSDLPKGVSENNNWNYRFRFVDSTQARDLIEKSDWEDKERYRRLLSILDENPTYWLYYA